MLTMLWILWLAYHVLTNGSDQIFLGSWKNSVREIYSLRSLAMTFYFLCILLHLQSINSNRIAPKISGVVYDSAQFHERLQLISGNSLQNKENTIRYKTIETMQMHMSVVHRLAYSSMNWMHLSMSFSVFTIEDNIFVGIEFWWRFGFYGKSSRGFFSFFLSHFKK